MAFSEIENKIQQENPRSIYLVLGEEPYLIDRFIYRFTEVLKKKHPSLEKINWDGTEQSIDLLFTELESLPFFSNYRLIIARSIGKIKRDFLEKLIQLQRNNSSSTLILVTQKKETFREISKIISEREGFIELPKPKGKEISSWIIHFAKEAGKTLGYSEAKLLIDFLGEDLSTLNHQVQLLSLFVGEKEKIDSEDICNLFSEVAVKNIFSLTKGIAATDFASTFHLIRSLLRQGEVPLKLFALLARHYRILLKTKLALKKGMDSREIAQILKLPFFVVEESISQSQNFSWRKLIRIYQELGTTDLLLKSSSVPSSMIFEKMVWGTLK